MSKVEMELEDVQLLWDHVVSSMDWGSGFLDEEEMWKILIIGARFGFKVEVEDLSYNFPNAVKAWDAEHPKPVFDYDKCRTRERPYHTPTPREVDKRTTEWRQYNKALREWGRARNEFFHEKLEEAVAKYDMTDPYNE